MVPTGIFKDVNSTIIYLFVCFFQHEYTFLLYLNPDWEENYYGETVLFDLVNSTNKVKPGDEEYEIVAVVRPRYGRIVVFRGNIPHSARPPSPGFKGARYTFACKVSGFYCHYQYWYFVAHINPFPPR